MVAFILGIVKFLVYLFAALKAIPVILAFIGVLWILHEL